MSTNAYLAKKGGGNLYKVIYLHSDGYPEYAQHGLMKQLILQALLDMRNNGQTISYLYPYSIPYYRKKGWELITDKLTYTITDAQLPKVIPVNGKVRRVELDDQVIKDVYDIFSKQQHGALIRHELEWQEYWRWEQEDMHASVYYDQNNQAIGYVLYQIYNDVFTMKELVYLNEESRIGLWNYITAHHSMVFSVKGCSYINEPLAFLLDDGDINEQIKPYYMARIVDVEAFLKAYPFNQLTNITFKIFDPILDFNNGYFSLNSDGTIIKDIKHPHIVELDIQTLVTMLMNYRRPTYLAKINRLKTDNDTINILENLIPRNAPYFSDYF
jgi:predicted acetyltransferase